MAFSNLFTKLCDVEGAVKDPSHRNEFKSGQGSSLKRKPQTMQTGPYVKRHCLQPYAAGVSDIIRNEEPKAPEAQRFNWANNNPRPGVSRDASHRHNQRTFSNNDHNAGNADNTQKKKKKKNKGKKKREMAARYKNAQRDNTQPRKPLMSKEFKEQHSLEVDGRLFCIYFLRGRCIKGEECQFEHIQGYNGLIKAACKFYIQGFCLKGKNCPYLHETFPCKFFHTQGICRRDQCMFSHDPLTDLNRKLLDDFIQRENELLELRKNAEEEALSQTENVSEALEEKTTVNIIIPTARPSFYQSSAVDALIPDGEQPAEEDNTPQTHDNVEPEVSLASTLEQPGSVCYSVEAMLGPKLFKPCLYTALKSQEAPPSESKTTPNNPLDVIDSPYSVASVLRSSTTSSRLHSTSIAPAVGASSESNYKETTIILDDKYAVSPSVQEKPPSFYDYAASQYHNNQCEKTTSWGTLKAKGELTIGLSVPNSMLEDEKITTECKREYIPLIKSNCPSQKYNPLMRSNCPSQKYLTSQVQKDKFGECDLKPSQFKEKPFLTSDTFISKPLPTNQVTSIQQNPKENDSKTIPKNVVASHKTTSRLNSLFGSLSPDVDQTSTVINSVCGNKAVQSAQKYESDGASQKVHLSEKKNQSLFTGNTSENSKNGCNSKNKRDEIGRHESPPAKKCHRLFASLSPDFSDKPAVQSALKREKPICHSEKIKCGSKQAAKPSQIPRNTSESTGNINTNLVCTSSTTNFKCSKQKEDIESVKTPAKSFQRIFETLTPDSSQTSTVCNSFSEKPSPQNDLASKTPPAKPFQSLFASLILDSNRTSAVRKCFSDKQAVPSQEKVERLNSSSNKATKPRQFTDNRSESTNDSSTSKHTKSVSISAKANINCLNKEEGIEFAETPAKSLQSLFTSLTPDSDRASIISNSFSKKTAVRSAQKSEKSICDSQTLKQRLFNENTSESPNNSKNNDMQVGLASNNSQGLLTSPATSKLNKKDDMVNAKTPPSKPFQSLFASLTPDSGQTSTVCNSFIDKPDVPSAERVEQSSCDSQKEGQTPSPFTENTSKSPNNGNGSHMQVGLAGASTKTQSNNSPGLITSPTTSKLKGTNTKEDTNAKASPAKPFQSLFASLTPDSDQTSPVCKLISHKTAVPSPQKCEKSICAGEKLNCGSNQATKPSPFTGNTSESTNNSRRKLVVCTSAMDDVNCLKREEDNESAKTPPAKPFQSLFTSLTPDSDQALTTNSSFGEKTPVLSAQKVAKSIFYGRTSTVCNSQNFVSASGSSDLNSENQEVDVKSVETPLKSFQSLIPTVDKNIKKDVLSYEKSKCDGQNPTSDSNQAKSTTQQSQFPENLSRSLNNGNNGQNSAMSNLKSKNRKDDTDSSEKTPPAKSFQSLFTRLTPEVDRTFIVQPQKVEKSICGHQKFKCDSSPTTKQSQYNENTTGSKVGFVAARLETLNGKCPKPFSSIGSANTPAKSFHHLFSAPLEESIKNKRTRESKNEPENKSATVNSPANPQHQSNNGPPNSILKSLFQQLKP